MWEVITQPLTFIAIANAISYCGAKPVFVDVDLDTLGMSPKALENFLEQNCKIENNQCINKTTKKIIKVIKIITIIKISNMWLLRKVLWLSQCRFLMKSFFQLYPNGIHQV